MVFPPLFELGWTRVLFRHLTASEVVHPERPGQAQQRSDRPAASLRSAAALARR
jgi:hypothetical protein